MPETFLDQLLYVVIIVLKIVAVLVPLILAVAYYTYAERKVIGYMQIRIGPNRVGFFGKHLLGLGQPIADAVKLMFKEIVVPTNANLYLFIIAPVLAFAPAMARKGWGRIVTFASLQSTRAFPGGVAYGATKGALRSLIRGLSIELAPRGIRVNAVRPGVIRTDMTAGVRDKYDKLIGEGLCVQPRWGLPEDVGRAVAMLVRGDLAYSTGQVIQVDGGLTLPRL